MTKFIRQISGVPGSGQVKTVFTSGAVSEDMMCTKFFMKMQKDGSSVEEARAYAEVGPMLVPTADWTEINRVLSTFKGA